MPSTPLLEETKPVSRNGDAKENQIKHAEQVSRILGEFNAISNNPALASIAFYMLRAMRLKYSNRTLSNFYGNIDLSMAVKDGKLSQLKLTDCTSFTVDSLSPPVQNDR